MLTDPAAATFALADFGLGAPASECAIFDMATQVLRVPNLELNGSYWVDLQVIAVENGVLLQLVDADVNP